MADDGASINIRRMAADLQDDRLIAIFFGKDAVAIEAKSHLKCYVAFSRRNAKLNATDEREKQECMKAAEASCPGKASKAVPKLGGAPPWGA